MKLRGDVAMHRFFLVTLIPLLPLLGEPMEQLGWAAAPHHFPEVVSIRRSGRKHVCTGVLINPRYILTSARCRDIVGARPVVTISPHIANSDNGLNGSQTAGTPLKIQAEWISTHSEWTGDLDDHLQAAILKLPATVAVTQPTLAASYNEVYTNSQLYAYRMKNRLEMVQFSVIQGNACSGLQNLPLNKFCLLSKWAEACDGCIGSPLIFGDIPKWLPSRGVMDWGTPNVHLVVGIISGDSLTANSSHNDGLRMGFILMPNLRPWVDDVIRTYMGGSLMNTSAQPQIRR